MAIGRTTGSILGEIKIMKTCIVFITLLVVISSSASAQDHLVPDTSQLVHPDGYHIKIHRIFNQAFEKEVILRAIVLPARLRVTHVVAVRVEDDKSEVIVLEASDIRRAESIERTEDQIKALKDAGEEVPPRMLEELKSLKADAPANYRDIKATRQARPIPGKLAEEIRTIWEEMLLDVRHPKKVIHGFDGVTYHFSAWIKGRGEISGHIWSPEGGSKMGELASLALMLGDFARGKVDPVALEEKVKQTRASINP